MSYPMICIKLWFYNIIMIRLYWNIGSQPARAVKALLQIGQIKHENVVINIMGNQARKPQYIQRNPLGQIPYIETPDGLSIGESTAILTYLCQKYPQPLGKYYGHNIQTRAKVNEMTSWYQSSLRPALFEMIKLKIYGSKRGGVEFDQRELRKAEKKVVEGLEMLERILKTSNSGYVCSSGLTFVDLQAFFEVTNLMYYEMEDLLPKFPLSEEWFGRIKAIKEVEEIHTRWLKGVPQFSKILREQQPSPHPRL